ncbi:hypothetical protein ACO1O0_007773 [Amphichorda felina]
MSLNGLDNPKVGGAYVGAVGEPGGWFLLKYASRDEVEVLGTGKGGIAELRKAVAEYDETNPLYGFLKYRRRNVLIKYLPEGCSRLIQARAAVHFNAVCERFSPYDAQFDMSTSSDLRDSKLSAACSLHAATGSNSSSGSVRRKHLMEIAEEDEEEHQQPAKRQSLIKDEDKGEGGEGADRQPPTATEPVTLNADLAASPEHSKFSAPTTSEVPNFTGTGSSPDVDANRRMSSQSGRAEVYSSYSSYSYKPKVKLGPRPSLETSSTRPQTAGNFRPVSSIPAGFKLFGKGGSAVSGKKSSPSSGRKDTASAVVPGSPTSVMTEGSFPTATFPIPEEPLAKTRFDLALRPATSSGVSTKSGMTTSSRATMTPEKARLKKAMQLREKKRKAAAKMAPSALAVPAATTTAADDNAEEKAGDQARDEKTGTDENGEVAVGAPDQTEQRMPIAKADSGIAIDASPASTKGVDVSSDATQSDSRPASPVIASSEAEQSTKASSVSESTDQTVEAAAEYKAVESGEASSSEGSTPKPTEVEPTTLKTSGTEASEVIVTGQSETENPAAEHEDASVAIEAVDNTTPTITRTSDEPEADPKDEIAEGQNETVGVPVSDAAEDIPVEAKSEEKKPETEEIPETKEDGIPASTEDVGTPSEAPSSHKPSVTAPAATDGTAEATAESSTAESTNVAADATADATAEEPSAASKQTALEDSPQIIPQAGPAPGPTENQATNEAQAISAAPRKQLSTRRRAVEPIRTDLNIATHQIDQVDQVNQGGRPTSQSEFNFSDSESLMEELQSATVQEARPMLVTKTPRTPVFPGHLSTAMAGPSSPLPSPASPSLVGPGKPHMVRTVSNPVRGNLVAPPTDVSPSSTRSLSHGAAYLHHVTQQRSGDPNMAKQRTGMGSGISQRIKALEMLSANSAESPSQPGSRPGSRPSSAFFAVKKDRVPSRSPSFVDRSNSLSRDARPTTAQSRERSPETSRFPRSRDRSSSISSRLSMFEPAGSPGNTPRGRPESISVTARIVRDSPSQSRNPSDQGPVELKQSPLLVDHHQPARDEPEAVEPAPEAANTANTEAAPSASRDRGADAGSRRSSFSLVRDFIKDGRKSLSSPSTDNLTAPAGHNNSGTGSNGGRSPSHPPVSFQNTGGSFTGRLPLGRRSLSKDREASSILSDDGDDAKSNSDKKKSRAGRLMRRLSSLSISSRNKIVSPTGGTPTVTEEILPSTNTTNTTTTTSASTPTAAPADNASSPSVVAHLGDVNVQFPDTLLWKRRNMSLDSQGFVVLSATQQQRAMGVKRYHLGDFRTPYVPDVEVQELPNSVVLDLVEGSAVQVACEDRAGQMNVLQVLRDAHAACAGH